MYRKDYEDVPRELEWSFDKEDRMLDPVDWVKKNLERVLEHRVSEALREKALMAIQHFVNTSTHFIVWSDELARRHPRMKDLPVISRKMAVLERKTFVSFYNYFIENGFEDLLDETLEKIINDPNGTFYWVNYFEHAIHAIIDKVGVDESLILQLKINALIQIREDFHTEAKKRRTTE